MSEPIQSAEDYSEEIVSAVESAITIGTTASLIKGSIDIAKLIKDRDAAHIALGRAEQKAEDDKIIEAMAKALEEISKIDQKGYACPDIKRTARILLTCGPVARKALALRNRG